MRLEVDNLSRRTSWKLAANVVKLRFEQFYRAFDRKYDPDQPRVPAGEPSGGQWTGDSGAINTRIAARSLAKEAECEALQQRDAFQCRMVGLRACWAQAALRYANCLADLPIPPLNY
jgi:hypothetical protein